MNKHRESAFLKTLDAQIEAHFVDNDLDVNHLLRFVGMSRTNLHCKLKDATGMSTTEYVRRFRLKKAAQLLINNPHWSVWAVAEGVGFDNLGYFCKRFKEHFGASPGAWRDMARAEAD